jgi:hypothetical protein
MSQCTNCGETNLMVPCEDNMPWCDIYCGSCGEQFEIKSKKSAVYSGLIKNNNSWVRNNLTTHKGGSLIGFLNNQAAAEDFRENNGTNTASLELFKCTTSIILVRRQDNNRDGCEFTICKVKSILPYIDKAKGISNTQWCTAYELEPVEGTNKLMCGEKFTALCKATVDDVKKGMSEIEKCVSDWCNQIKK